ncbi:MAG TPA: acyl-CoA dehydrogenase family protein [Bryobacteraceae bacterium]|nr:acyl-CoA dehydrogenase family protein [Bryobacteraceae bacterium]
MSTIAQTYEESLERICRESIAPNAPSVDRNGAFPEQAIESLRAAGFLGAMSSPEIGGLGLGLGGTAKIVRRVAEECGSTAMVLCMHYCGVAVLEAHAPVVVRRAAATGDLSTLAFSEAGSRSHFWAPQSTASNGEGEVVLNARKSWVTSASRATAYVWSSRPLGADGISTIWLVPSNTSGLVVEGPFEGLGLRGNDSCPVSANDVRVPHSSILGEDGKGFEVMMGIVLPAFSILSAACSVGFMNAGTARTAAHAAQTKHSDTGSALAELPTIRNYIARMQIKTDMASALLNDAIAAIETARPDASLRVLESKACAGETANEVLDLAMRVCGGAAFRKEVGVERYFRDARAAGVMAPTTDVLYDFIGKAVCGLPLF